MNKDKAIQLLERLQDPEPYEPMLTKDAYDAIQMAIDALSADGDTISRQAAISAICNACGKIDCDKMDKCEKLQLPPANCSEFPNSSDTISRQQAIESLHMHLMYRMGTDSNKKRLDDWINNLPSAQPEIIHCGDCKYQDENWRRVSVRWLPCMEVRTGSNWYCGSAERRTDE